MNLEAAGVEGHVMDASISNDFAERSSSGAPLPFALPRVYPVAPFDGKAVAPSPSIYEQQRHEHQKQHAHGIPPQQPPLYTVGTPPGKEGNVWLGGWSNSNLSENVLNALSASSRAATLSVTTAAATSASRSDPLIYEPRTTMPLTSPSYALSPESPGHAEFVHTLVVFDKAFCVCFVPPPLRRSLKVGELVLCECAHGENVGTVVSDVSPLIAEIIKRRLQTTSISSVEEAFTPSCGHATEAGSSAPKTTANDGPSERLYTDLNALFDTKPRCGLPADHLLRRLPCVLRCGTNRDKKRVYFARLRSNDALVTVQRIMRDEALVVQGAEYEVSFACVTVYLWGESNQCLWSSQRFEQLGKSLVVPLRSDIVEFRFCSEQHHDQLDLTRAITGMELSESLYAIVAEHRERHGLKGSALGAHAMAAFHPSTGKAIEHCSHELQQETQMPTTQHGFTSYVASPARPSQPAASYAPQSYPQQQQQCAVGYTFAPYVYVSDTPPQQRESVRTIPLQSGALANPQQVGQPLSLVQVHYPTAGLMQSAPGVYWAGVRDRVVRNQLEAPTQHGMAQETSYYYVMNPAPQQPQQGAVVPLPIINTQEYQAAPYSVILPLHAPPYTP